MTGACACYTYIKLSAVHVATFKSSEQKLGASKYDQILCVQLSGVLYTTKQYLREILLHMRQRVHENILEKLLVAVLSVTLLFNGLLRS